jgi:hypothetical protein
MYLRMCLKGMQNKDVTCRIVSLDVFERNTFQGVSVKNASVGLFIRNAI